MSESQFLSALSRILYQNSSNFSGNQLFGLVSLILLLEIVEIFKQDNATQAAAPEVKKNKGGLPDLSSITGLLSQLPGSDNTDSGGSNMQQMLPLLMSALSGNTGGGSAPDLGTLMQLMKSLNFKQEAADSGQVGAPEEQDQEAENGDKKKAR